MGKMFDFITGTCNPLGGRCRHNCVYCWSMGDKGLVNRFDMQKYCGEPQLYPKEQERILKFKKGEFIFIQDMSDLFADDVPTRLILQVLDHIRRSPARFLLLTKNPTRYIRFIKDKEFPDNVVLGCTIESDDCVFYSKISQAPPLGERLVSMTYISRMTKLSLFISVEPIMDFGNHFSYYIKECCPWAVAVGYDNYKNSLDEPILERTMMLIDDLEKFTKVYPKTLRKAWYEESKHAY